MKILARALLLSILCGWQAAGAQESWAVYPFTFSVRALVPTTTELIPTPTILEHSTVTTSVPVLHNNASFLKLMQAPRGFKLGAVFSGPGALAFDIVAFNPAVPGATRWVGVGALAGIGEPIPVLDSPSSGVAFRQTLATFIIAAAPPGADVPIPLAGVPEAVVAVGLPIEQIVVAKTTPEIFLQIKPAGAPGRTGTLGSTGLLQVVESIEEESSSLAIPTEAVFSITLGRPLGFVTEMEADAVRARGNALRARGPIAPLTMDELKAFTRP